MLGIGVPEIIVFAVLIVTILVALVVIGTRKTKE